MLLDHISFLFFDPNNFMLVYHDTVVDQLDRPCDKDGGSTNSKATTVWRARAGSQETGPPLQTFQGHSESRLAMVWHPTNWTGCYCSGQTALAHTFTICVICARGRASPSSTVRQRTPPLGSLYPSDKCELPVPRLRTALQVQDRPAEPLPYPQIRGTDNVILETEGPPWWWLIIAAVLWKPTTVFYWQTLRGFTPWNRKWPNVMRSFDITLMTVCVI